MVPGNDGSYCNWLYGRHFTTVVRYSGSYLVTVVNCHGSYLVRVAECIVSFCVVMYFHGGYCHGSCPDMMVSAVVELLS